MFRYAFTSTPADKVPLCQVDVEKKKKKKKRRKRLLNEIPNARSTNSKVGMLHFWLSTGLWLYIKYAVNHMFEISVIRSGQIPFTTLDNEYIHIRTSTKILTQDFQTHVKQYF